MSKVICLGIMVADLIAKPVNEIPKEGKLTIVDTMELHTGGCAVNTAIDLAKIGEDVGIIGLVGNDGMGDYLAGQIQSNGVNTEGLKRTNQKGTSTSMVLSSSSGERSFIHTLGANQILNESHVDYSIIEECDLLFIAGALLMPSFDGKDTVKVLKKAKQMDKITILDTAWNDDSQWMNTLEDSMKYLDYFIPSIEEAEMLSGTKDEKEMAEIFMNKGVKNVVIKLGAKGCYIKNANEEYYVDSFKVEPVDTNGAGDSFVAGFITGIVNGWTLEQSGIFANAVGAHCVKQLGASSGIVSKRQILEYISQNDRGWDNNEEKSI